MSEKQQYKDISETLFLPKTSFAMRAGLPEQEPKILEEWSKKDIYKALRSASKDKKKFTLHDGPPYANGNLHMGHALNKILKDFVVRSQQMLNQDSSYIPGWDCHGLPIEWKIEEQYRSKGKNKDEIDILQFRKECREFAEKWIDIQREEFIRLGVTGDWYNPYTTMSFNAEATIVNEFFKFVENGSLYRGSKPVMWSTVEKTALAEAEIEYKEHKSTTIVVKFPIKESSIEELSNAAVLIWTTTPWTIPGNRAIAFSKDIKYSLYEVSETLEKCLLEKNEKIVIADDLLENFLIQCKVSKINKICSVQNLDKIVCHHPFVGSGYEFDVRLYNADFVTLEQGTGFVHIAPGHGADDYVLGIENNVEVPETVNENGEYFQHIPIFKGIKIFNDDGSDAEANVAVIKSLAAHKNLAGKGSLRHSYPHSWRSKAPVIFRNTPQWFISMESNNLRTTALKEIEKVKWFPKQGKNRIYSMIEERPDWVVSRQRAWGVPLSIFYKIETGEVLVDKELNKKIVNLYENEGSDAWFKYTKEELLGSKYNADEYAKVNDILDVWFDSGCTHAFVLDGKENQIWPASIYLEGTDQHRGWFHSSLLESCGTRGIAPYESVLTHGFVLHEDGLKMSKSSSNIVSPTEIVDKSGADILRLWVASSDYSEDLKIGPDIIKSNIDSYRRLRNTLRFILGNLSDFSKDEVVPFDNLNELDQYILSELSKLESKVIENYKIFEYQKVFSMIFNFCTNDLSSFYFDIRKDSLYCDSKNNLTRRSTRTVLDILFHHLLKLLAPLLCFTTEEAWQSRYGNDDSIHMQLFPNINESWINNDLDERWSKYKQIRKFIYSAIEEKRKDKIIGSSLEADVILFLPQNEYQDLDQKIIEDIAIVSKLRIDSSNPPKDSKIDENNSSLGVQVSKVSGEKCERCWKYFDVLDSNLCDRCIQNVK